MSKTKVSLLMYIGVVCIN